LVYRVCKCFIYIQFDSVLGRHHVLSRYYILLYLYILFMLFAMFLISIALLPLSFWILILTWYFLLQLYYIPLSLTRDLFIYNCYIQGSPLTHPVMLPSRSPIAQLYLSVLPTETAPVFFSCNCSCVFLLICPHIGIYITVFLLLYPTDHHNMHSLLSSLIWTRSFCYAKARIMYTLLFRNFVFGVHPFMDMVLVING